MYRNIFLLLSFILLVGITGSWCLPDEEIHDISIHAYRDPSSEISIFWNSKLPDSNLVLEVFKNPTGELYCEINSISPFPYFDKKNNINCFRYYLQLQNLEPGTVYRYTISSVNSTELASGYFITDKRKEAVTCPEKLLLGWTSDPHRSIAINWSSGTERNRIEFARGEDFASHTGTYPRTYFVKNSDVYESFGNEFINESYQYYFHRWTIDGLEPGKIYKYRIGDSICMSEWNQFRVPSIDEPLKFIYYGDIQNEIENMVSPVVRSSFIVEPKSDFKIYAGDLVSSSSRESQWVEWHNTAGWINGTMPTLAACGNHEYDQDMIHSKYEVLTRYWPYQFPALPNGPEDMPEVYYLDIKNTRIIILNSTAAIIDKNNRQKQADWFYSVIKNNTQKWTIVVLHHPIWGTYGDENQPILFETFFEIFEKNKIDLVLQGHYHSYARSNTLYVNNKKYHCGTTYMTSSATPFTLPVDENDKKYMDKTLEGLQLFSIITCKSDRLLCETYTPDMQIIDEFMLSK